MVRCESFVPKVYRYALPPMRISKNEEKYVVKRDKIVVEGEIVLKNDGKSFDIKEGSGISFQVPWGFVPKLECSKSKVKIHGKCEDHLLKSYMKRGISVLFVDVIIDKSCKRVKSGESIKFCYEFSYHNLDFLFESFCTFYSKLINICVVHHDTDMNVIKSLFLGSGHRQEPIENRCNAAQIVSSTLYFSPQSLLWSKLRFHTCLHQPL